MAVFWIDHGYDRERTDGPGRYVEHVGARLDEFADSFGDIAPGCRVALVAPWPAELTETA